MRTTRKRGEKGKIEDGPLYAILGLAWEKERAYLKCQAKWNKTEKEKKQQKVEEEHRKESKNKITKHDHEELNDRITCTIK
jgi:hypothetical protein